MNWKRNSKEFFKNTEVTFRLKKKLIVLTGPTSVGKTKLSIALAKAVGGEIISADSMQVYKHMDIGSAKIKKEEMQGVTHHLIDIMEPEEEFNVVVFQKLAKQKMEEIYSRNHIPILVGGTGFYIQSVLYDIDFTENRQDSDFRMQLETLANEKGGIFLHQMLERVDPVAADQIHEKNVKRVIRALEFHSQTGLKISEHNETERQKQSPYNSFYFVLTDNRDKLYRQINERVDQMIDEGLVQEVTYLKNRGLPKEAVSMQGLGYKELLEYLNHECTLEEAVEIIKRDTRHFAKRQLTWFRREKEVIWIDKEQFLYDDDQMITYMLEMIQSES